MAAADSPSTAEVGRSHGAHSSHGANSSHRSSSGQASDVLLHLDEAQRAAASAVSGPVCILAGAGTGKTRAITHRIAYAVRSGAVPADAVLAVTFTARAAGELRERLRKLGVGGVQARTFHAAALRQLTYFAPQILGGPLPKVADNSLRWVSQAANRLRLRTDRAELRDIAAEIDWAKASLVSPAEYVLKAASANRGISLTPQRVAQAYEAYEEVKHANDEIDFSDLLLIMAGALEEIPAVARVVRAQYRYFVIDEYQDVSPLQQRLLDAWLGDREDVCVVGDPNQTIYSFAGARPSYLLDFPERYPSAAIVRLVSDYRSTPQIVELANRLINSGSTGSGAGHRDRATDLVLVGQRPDGPRPSFAEYDDEVAEAKAAAGSIQRLLAEGVPAAEIAVLFRVNAQSEVYEQALDELAIPYLLRGGEKFFERAEIRQALVLLRGAARTGEDTSISEAMAQVLSSLGWHSTQPPPGASARERWESLAALAELAAQFVVEQPDLGLEGFNTELAQRAASAHAPTVQGVTLASLHSAKGLEWDVVFLVGLVDQTIPIQHATTPEQLAEERRLLYVGITRARQQLALSWALARSPGQARRRRPSRFLDGLRPGAGTQRSPRQASKKAAPMPPDSENAAIFGRLRAWRKEQATEQGVPAYVVFSDVTLVAIAEAAPSDEAELGQITGVGPIKLARYGQMVLDVLSQ